MSNSGGHHSIVRRRVLYRGRVQGVGFRYTAHRIAMRFNISGYVRNLASGAVELLAIGESDVLDKFLAGVAEAMGGNISGYDIEDDTSGEEISGFHIRY